MDIYAMYNAKPCVLCGRKNTEKNVEGVIHHNAKLACVDQLACRRVRKKANKHWKRG